MPGCGRPGHSPRVRVRPPRFLIEVQGEYPAIIGLVQRPRPARSEGRCNAAPCAPRHQFRAAAPHGAKSRAHPLIRNVPGRDLPRQVRINRNSPPGDQSGVDTAKETKIDEDLKAAAGSGATEAAGRTAGSLTCMRLVGGLHPNRGHPQIPTLPHQSLTSRGAKMSNRFPGRPGSAHVSAV